ncbi:MAG: hypothetical protein IJ463_03770 [Bacilli bacterium]|nr:hypothetical protein [Bacilli bacterium]
MNFLLDLGIKQNTINSIKTKYDEGVIDNFRVEEDNVEEVINYFREIGIVDIDNLLIFDLTIFTKDIDYVKECFNKHNLKEVVKSINEDITYITKI